MRGACGSGVCRRAGWQARDWGSTVLFVAEHPRKLDLLVHRGNGPGHLRLWPMLVVLPLAFILVIAALAGLAWGTAAWLHFPALPRPRTLSLREWTGLLQLVLASVAGAGALVALIVAYRRQRVAEADSFHDRSRVANERFVSAAGQLGDDRPAVRLAGVYGMAGLADDWIEQRQTCVDVLCAYLRMPAPPEPGTSPPAARRQASAAELEVRDTIIRVVGAHLRPGATMSWQGLGLDFTAARLEGGDFEGAVFRGDMIYFDRAVFESGMIDFKGAVFSRGTVSFRDAVFSGATVSFTGAVFSGGTVNFEGAKFAGGNVSFDDATFGAGTVNFGGAEFSGGTVSFRTPRNWSRPPVFDFTGTPPPVVTLPDGWLP